MVYNSNNNPMPFSSHMAIKSFLFPVLVAILTGFAIACGGGGGSSETTNSESLTQTKVSIDLADFSVLHGRAKVGSTWLDVKKVKLSVNVEGKSLFQNVELMHLGGTIYEVLLNNLPIEKNLIFELKALDKDGDTVVKVVTSKRISREEAARPEAPTLSVPVVAVIEFEGQVYQQDQVEQILADIEQETTGGGEEVTVPPAGGGEEVTAPPTGGGEEVTAPPTGGGEEVTVPPAGGGEEVTVPPAGGGEEVTVPPAGGGEEVTVPPAGGGEEVANGGEAQDGNQGDGGVVTPTASANVNFYNYESLADGSLFSINQKYGFSAMIKDGLIAMTPRGSGKSIKMQVLSYGRSGTEQLLTSPAELLTGTKLIQSWGGDFQASYENRSNGFEQIFIVNGKPTGVGELKINIDLDVDTLEYKNSQFYLTVDQKSLIYGKLKVFDANGTVLASQFSHTGKTIQIGIDDQNAVYPITIDPTVTAASAVVILDSVTVDGIIDTVQIQYAQVISSDNSLLSDWTVAYSGSNLTISSKTIDGSGANLNLNLNTTGMSVDTQNTLFSVVYVQNASNLIYFNPTETSDNISLTGAGVTDEAPPVLLSASYSSGTAPAGDLLGKTVNTLTLQYSENVIVNGGALAVGDNVVSSASIGSTTALNMISGLVTYASGNLVTPLANDHTVELMSAGNAIRLYFNTDVDGHYMATNPAPSQPTAISNTSDVKDSANMAVVNIGTGVVVTSSTWDVTPLGLAAVTPMTQYDLDSNGTIDRVRVIVNESIPEGCIVPGEFRLADSMGNAIASGNSAVNATTFDLTFDRTGTEAKTLQHFVAGNWRDLAGNRVAAYGYMGPMTDSAPPVLMTADFGRSAPVGTDLNGYIVNNLVLAYSESIILSNGSVIATGANALSNSNLGDMTTGNVLSGLISWTGSSGNMVSNTANDHYVEHTSANSITVFFNSSASGYFSSGSTAPTTPTVTAITASTYLKDIVNQGAIGSAIATNSTAWDVTRPSVAGIVQYDSDVDGSIDLITVNVDEDILESSVVFSDFTLTDSNGSVAATGNVSGNSTQFDLVMVRGGTETKNLQYTLGSLRDLSGNPLMSSTNLGMISDNAQPVFLAATYSTGTVPSGVLSGNTVNTLTLAYSENIIVNNGIDLSVGSNVFSNAALGDSSVLNSISGLVTYTTGDLTSPGATNHIVEHKSSGNEICIYFNADPSSYFVNAITNPSLPSSITDATRVRDASGLAVMDSSSGVTLLGPTWDTTLPTIDAFTQYDTDFDGQVDQLLITVSEDIVQSSVDFNDFNLLDGISTVTGSSNSVMSTTSFTVDFNPLFGTETKILQYTQNGLRDLAGNRVATSANVGIPTDAAGPALMYADFGRSAPAGTDLDGLTINHLILQYSENIIVSNGSVIPISGNALCNANIGDMTTGNVLTGLVSWSGVSGGNMVSNAAADHYVEHTSANSITIFFNSNASGYFSSGSTAPTIPRLLTNSAPLYIKDASNNGATGNVISSNSTAWDVTAPVISEFYTIDSNGDGYINSANISFSDNILDVSTTVGDFVIDNDVTVGGGQSGISFGTGVTYPNSDSDANDEFLSLSFNPIAGTQSKFIHYTKGDLRDLAGNKLASTIEGPSVDWAVPILWQVEFSKMTAPVGTDLANKKVNAIILSYSENVHVSMNNTMSDDLTSGGVSSRSTALMGGLADVAGNILKGLISWDGPAGYNLKNNAETDNAVELSSDNVITVYLNAENDGRFLPVTPVGPTVGTVVTAISDNLSVYDQDGFPVNSSFVPNVVIGASPWDESRPTLSLVTSPVIGTLVTDYNLSSLNIDVTFSENMLFSDNTEFYHLSDNGSYQNLSSDNLYIQSFADTSLGAGPTKGTLDFGPSMDRFKSGNLVIYPDALIRDEVGLPLDVVSPIYYYIQTGNVAHYDFEDGTGLDSINTAYTASFNATLVGTGAIDETAWIIDGNAISVQGGNLNVSSLDQRNFPQPKGSIEFWYQTKKSPSVADVIFGDTVTPAGNYFDVRYSGSGNTYLWRANGLASGNYIHFDMSEESWHHLSLLYNDGNLGTMVLDGLSVGNTMNLVGFNPTDQDVIFASSNIDNVRFYDVVNTESDMQDYFIPLMTASWPIDESIDVDFSSNIISDNIHDFDAYLVGNPVLAEGHHGSGNSIHLRSLSSGNMGFDASDFGKHLFPHHREGSMYFWVRPNPTTSTATWILDDQDSSRNHFVIQGTGTVGQYSWTAQMSNGNVLTSSNFELQDHAWNYLGMTWESAGNIKLYVNGSANVNFDNSLSQWTPDGQIVCSTPNGYLDDIYIMDSVVPSSNFLTEFNTWHSPSGNYSFDGLTSNFLQDDIGWSYILDDTGYHHQMYFSGNALPTLDVPHYGEVSGNSLHFGDYVGMDVYSLESQFFSSDNGTYAFWWKPDYKDNGTVEVLDANSYGARDHFFIESSDNIGNYRVVLVDENNTIAGNSQSFQPVMERWNHIALTWGNDGSNQARFYFNGNIQKTWTINSWRPVDQITASTPNGSLDDFYIESSIWTADQVANEYFNSVKNLNEVALAGTFIGTTHANIIYGFGEHEIVSSNSYGANLMTERDQIALPLTSPINYAIFSNVSSANVGHHRYVDDADLDTPLPTDSPVLKLGAQEFASGESFWVPSLDKQRFPQTTGTIRFWYKPVPAYSGQAVVFGGDYVNDRSHADFFRIVETATKGIFDFDVFSNGSQTTYSNVELHPNVFNYITVSWDAGVITLFINGYERTMINMGATWTPADQLFVSTPNGSLDMMYLENVTRDEAFIRNNYFLTYVTPAGFYNFEGDVLDQNVSPTTANDGLATSSGFGIGNSFNGSDSLDLTGVNDYFEVPSLLKDLFPQIEGVVRLWVNPNGGATMGANTCLFDIEETGRNHFYISAQGPGSYRFGIQDTGTRNDYYDFVIAKSSWSHVAFNWSEDRDNINLMVNGEVIYTTGLGSWRPDKQFAISTPAGYIDDLFISYLPESIHEVEDYYYSERSPEPLNSSLFGWGNGTSGQLGNDGFLNINQPTLNNNFIRVKKVAGGTNFGLALLDNGMLQSWGTNTKGQLGDNTIVTRESPANIPLVNGVVDIDCGTDFAIAVLANGNVMAWGNNAKGQLGGASAASYLAFPTLVPGVDNVVAVACGNAHVLVVTSANDVISWGNNDNSQCIGAGLTPYTPTSQGYADAIAVAAGRAHSLILRTGGAIDSYGDDSYHQGAASGVSTAKAIACGSDHNLALLADGSVVAWGRGNFGQSGNASLEDVVSPTAIVDSTGSAISGVTEITAGGYTSYALVSDNTMRSWGDGSYEQLGNGLTQSSSAGNVAVAANVMALGKAGQRHLHAIVAKDSYYKAVYDREVSLTFDQNDLSDSGLNHFDGWFNDSPTSGNGHSGNATYGKGKALKFEDDEYLKVPHLEGANFPQDAGTVSIWFKPDASTPAGANIFGDGDTSINQFLLQYNGVNAVDLSLYTIGAAPILISPAINPLASLSVTQDEWNYISFSWDTSTNKLIALSNGVSSPISIVFDTWRPSAQTVYSKPGAWIDNIEVLSQLTTEEEMINEYENGLSLFSGEFVSAWGANAGGQLGDGTTSNRLAPVLATELEAPADVGIGLFHSVVLLSNGTVKTKGLNCNLGQLGNGSSAQHLTLTTISGFQTSVTKIAVGLNSSLALMSNGNVMSWGDNYNGKLGIGSTDLFKNSPVVLSSLSGVSSIAVGSSHMLALLSNGEVWSWGQNDQGQLGIGSTVNSNIPVKVNLAGTVAAIACGDTHSMALMSTGLVYVWGNNNRGQLGDGLTTDSTTPKLVSAMGGISSIAAGSAFSLAYSSSASSLYGFGDTRFGLTTGTSLGSYVRIAVIGNVSELSAGTYHALLRLSDGTIYSWGRNDAGQLGQGDLVNLSSPTQVSGLTNIIRVLARGSSSYAIGQ